MSTEVAEKKAILSWTQPDWITHLTSCSDPKNCDCEVAKGLRAND